MHLNKGDGTELEVEEGFEGGDDLEAGSKEEEKEGGGEGENGSAGDRGHNFGSIDVMEFYHAC